MKKLNTKDEDFYRDILEKAYEISGPDNEFVNSCENFLNNRGFLSEKQVESLGKVKPPIDPYEDDLDTFGDEHEDDYL